MALLYLPARNICLAPDAMEIESSGQAVLLQLLECMPSNKIEDEHLLQEHQVWAQKSLSIEHVVDGGGVDEDVRGAIMPGWSCCPAC